MTAYNTHIVLDRQPIALDTILWLEGDWNYTRIYAIDQPVRISAYTLKWYERHLTGFLRIRKDVMVNPAHVLAVERISSRPRRMKVILINGEHIEVTRRRQAFILQKLKIPVNQLLKANL